MTILGAIYVYGARAPVTFMDSRVNNINNVLRLAKSASSGCTRNCHR